MATGGRRRRRACRTFDGVGRAHCHGAGEPAGDDHVGRSTPSPTTSTTLPVVGVRAWAPCSTASRVHSQGGLDFVARSQEAGFRGKRSVGRPPLRRLWRTPRFEPSVAERRPDEIGPDADRRAPVWLVRAPLISIAMSPVPGLAAAPRLRRLEADRSSTDRVDEPRRASMHERSATAVAEMLGDGRKLGPWNGVPRLAR